MRQRIALALCVLWLAGFEVLPWVHVATHDRIAPHIHTADGGIVYVPASTPGAHVHTHVYPRLPEHRAKHRDDGLSRLASALAHGEHSLVHHGVAVPAPAPVWTAPLPVDRRPITLAREVALAPVSRDCVRAVARGPPRADV